MTSSGVRGSVRTLRHIFLRVTVILLCATLSACGAPSSKSIFSSGKSVTVGVKNDQPGTGYEDNYKRNGFDIAVANNITNTLGTTASFSDIPSDSRETVLVNHEEQLVIATFSITADRLKHIDFAGPYAVTYQGFMLRKDEPDINTTAALKGKRVCSWSGTTSWDEIYQQYGMNAYQRPDANDCIKDLRSKSADAVSTDQMILYGFTERYQDLKVMPKLTIGPAQYYGIGIAKNNRADCNRLKVALKSYVNSSTWDDDFSSNLPSITHADPDWVTDYKPSADEIDSMSCNDHPGS